MRDLIGVKIRNRRKSLGLSQAGLARAVGISPSYLNLVEGNKRRVGGALLLRIAQQLKLPIEELSGESERRLVQDVEELLADPVLGEASFPASEAHALVAQFPNVALAMIRLHRAYADASANAEAYANRLSSDPLLAQLLHQVLSQITAMRSGAEILQTETDLSEEDRRRFVASINREAQALSDGTRAFISYFEESMVRHRSVSPSLEVADLIVSERNYFPGLETAADTLRAEVDRMGPFGETTLAALLEQRFGVTVQKGAIPDQDEGAFSREYRFDADRNVMWFHGSTTAATRQFQLARLFAELAVPEVLDAHIRDRRLTSPTARRLAHRAMSSYVAGAIVLPYSRLLEDAERSRYDIDFLSHSYTASFEQVAHRLVTLRRPGEEGIPFGFLRSDPAGRLTKHFPLPGLPLPSTGHACPLWAIYAAFRQNDQIVRQLVSFPDRSRYLFIAKAVSKRTATYREQPFYSSVMLACDFFHADRTVYGRGLNLDRSEAIPVGPACRLCIRRDCPHRQEESFDPTGESAAIRNPLVPRSFDLGVPT